MRKCNSNKGFTLMEMLACVVTLLLIGLICTAGLNLALNSYRTSVFESDSQMLESTLDMYVGDIVRYAKTIQTDSEGRVLSFTNEAYKIYDGIIGVPERVDGQGGMLLLYQTSEAEGVLVFNENAYAKNLYIEDFTLYYNESTGVFTGSYTIRSTQIEQAAKACTFSYRTIVNY